MNTPAPSATFNLNQVNGIIRNGDKCYNSNAADGLAFIGYGVSEGLNIGGLIITCLCILVFGAIAISSKNSLAIVMLVCCCSSLAGGIWNEFDIKSKQNAIIARSPATPCTSA